MRRSRKPIVIASRKSRLARVQAEMVGRALAKLHPKLEIRYHWIVTEGDERPGSLAEAGGKGLFTRALEQTLLSGDADLAVHSLKDLPARMTPGLQIAAVPARADVRDCLVSAAGYASIDALPSGAAVGTSSPRRAAQLLRARPDLEIVPLRGNVDTRLRKLGLADAPATTAAATTAPLSPNPKSDHLAATVLAVAGLRRLGLVEHATHTLDPELMLPAACQGALGIQCRADDHVTLTRCLPLNDPTAATLVHAERELVAALNADCYAPLAVLCQPITPPATRKRRTDSHWYRFRARAMSRHGHKCLQFDTTAAPQELRRVVKRCAAELIERNAARVMAEGSATQPPAQPA